MCVSQRVNQGLGLYITLCFAIFLVLHHFYRVSHHGQQCLSLQIPKSVAKCLARNYCNRISQFLEQCLGSQSTYCVCKCSSLHSCLLCVSTSTMPTVSLFLSASTSPCVSKESCLLPLLLWQLVCELVPFPAHPPVCR